jgi:simple sugar transport system permease protein
MNPIISGMGINAVALGGTNYMSQRLITVDTPDKIPVLPESLYYVLAVSLPVLVAIYAATTRGGLWLKAAGGDPRKARLAGLRPDRIRLGGLFATGVFSGLSGVLIVTHASRYVDGMTDGRGYIALAALILGGWKPVRAAVACLAFGFFSALQIQFQGTNLFGAQLPSEVWSSFPFVATVFALALLSGQSSAPPGLGKL